MHHHPVKKMQVLKTKSSMQPHMQQPTGIKVVLRRDMRAWSLQVGQAMHENCADVCTSICEL
jgi:hypothetical protein